MKNKINLLLTSFFLLGLTNCEVNSKESEDTSIDTSTSETMKEEIKKRELKEIVYEKSALTQKIKSSSMFLQLEPITTYNIGDVVTITTCISQYLANDHKYAYYICDWGDGTWSYIGPKYADEINKALVNMTHSYKKEGLYKIKTAVVDLSNGTLTGWSNEESVEVLNKGSMSNEFFMIDNVKPIASSNEEDAKNIIDNEKTYWKNKQAEDAESLEYVGLIFDKAYKLDSLEVKFPSSEDEFACNIAVEYTTDNGKTWYALPKYYYLNDYEIGRYSPIMRFPNPKGATLTFALDGIVANGIRFSSKLFLSEAREFSVEELRVYGNEDLLLYSSSSETYDADLNNMWTIYGSALCEPMLRGTLSGEAPNGSPFRSGFGMIASTEWLEWNGLKINWLDYPKLQESSRDALLNARYGPDGWSNYEGYIYATPSAAQHLGTANHYSLNPIFIIAARNYLLQGNNTIINTDDGQVNFLDHVNSQNQTMMDRIEKAMSYMLTALEGTSGVLTINDPRNAGLADSVSSNYWDAHHSFGYKSAYENVYFYASLLAMADIKNYLGLETEANFYLELAKKTKEQFNKLFFDAKKGRYISSINREGKRLDFGITYINFMACKYGLADDNTAKLIYSWVDGARTIDGDTSTGEDIYGEFKYAARSCTVDVSTIKDDYGRYYWEEYSGNLPCTPGTFGGFNHQMQNGGTIFYISYYDVVGRINTNIVETAKERFDTIISEFHEDSLRRNRYMMFSQGGTNGIGEYSEGVLGEFPESGLVPYSFIEGFIGLSVTPKGLKISANLPSDLQYAGIRSYIYGNQKYSIQVSKQISEPIVKYNDQVIFVAIPASDTYYITLDGRLIKE